MVDAPLCHLRLTVAATSTIYFEESVLEIDLTQDSFWTIVAGIIPI